MTETETVPSADDYALTAEEQALVAAPELPYQPSDPKNYRPNIAIVGAGGISAAHLGAYRAAGYNVVAICDLKLDRAERRRAEYFPDAVVTPNIDDLLKRPDIEVFDIATHPPDRITLIEKALDAGKHVLSQKPFVLDLDVGEVLVARARRNNVKLAVNQNGRWAPHFAYMREAVRRGLIGDVQSVHVAVHWDHSWTKGTPFEDIDDLVFYDFAIHWFDFVASLVGDRATSVFALRAFAKGQVTRVPMLASALVGLEGGQASLVFDADTHYGPLDTTYISGTKGTLRSQGPNLGEQAVTFTSAAGEAHPALLGSWFNDGFHGTMAELLSAIAENREPSNSAANNLKSLELCFAAIASSHTGQPVKPGSVRRLHVAIPKS